MPSIYGGQLRNHGFGLTVDYKWITNNKTSWMYYEELNIVWLNLIFLSWFSLIFHCMKAVFVLCPENKLMVPDLTTKDCENYWWFLL